MVPKYDLEVWFRSMIPKDNLTLACFKWEILFIKRYLTYSDHTYNEELIRSEKNVNLPEWIVPIKFNFDNSYLNPQLFNQITAAILYGD